MSSISQSVLMALTVTVNKFASSNVHAVQRREVASKRASSSSSTSTPAFPIFGRRGILLSALVAAYPVSDSRTELLKKYLKKSEENKTKNDKERLDSYYKRNYKDYFDLVEGSLRGKKEQELSESEKEVKWASFSPLIAENKLMERSAHALNYKIQEVPTPQNRRTRKKKREI